MWANVGWVRRADFSVTVRAILHRAGRWADIGGHFWGAPLRERKTRHMRKLAYLLPALGALAIGACSSDSGRKQETFELLPGEPGTCAETVLSTNSDFCDDDCGASLKCDEADRGQIENCCVLQTAPKLDNKLTRSSRVEEYSGTGAPQLSCFTPAGYPTKIASGTGNTDTVTLTGVLKAFSGGCDLKGVTIEVYEVLRKIGRAHV